MTFFFNVKNGRLVICNQNFLWQAGGIILVLLKFYNISLWRSHSSKFEKKKSKWENIKRKKRKSIHFADLENIFFMKLKLCNCMISNTPLNLNNMVWKRHFLDPYNTYNGLFLMEWCKIASNVNIRRSRDSRSYLACHLNLIVNKKN